MTGKENTNRRRGDGRVAFLAYADDFRELLEAGHPQQAVFDKYAKRLGISYSQFTRYVNRYLKAKDDHDQKDISTKKEGGQQQPDRPSEPQKERDSGPFNHDASSGNNRDDLI